MVTDSSPRTAPGAAADDYRVLTPERVSLQFEIAGIGSRAAAALIDGAVQMALGLALSIVLSTVLAQFIPNLDDSSAVVVVITLIVFFLGLFFLLWGYYLVFEMIWNGQTPGKRILGIRVIRENGYPIRASDAVIRNLVRVVDGPPFAFIVGATIMLLNDRARRAGDFAAGTIVVREGKAQRLDQLTAFASASPPASPRPAADLAARTTGASSPGGASGTAGSSGGQANGQPAGPVVALSPEDATLLRDFLVRRHTMAPAARSTLAARLAAHFARRYGLARPEPVTFGPATTPQDEPFLESLASA